MSPLPSLASFLQAAPSLIWPCLPSRAPTCLDPPRPAMSRLAHPNRACHALTHGAVSRLSVSHLSPPSQGSLSRVAPRWPCLPRLAWTLLAATGPNVPSQVTPCLPCLASSFLVAPCPTRPKLGRASHALTCHVLSCTAKAVTLLSEPLAHRE
jgi:hypothetical protein